MQDLFALDDMEDMQEQSGEVVPFSGQPLMPSPDQIEAIRRQIALQRRLDDLAVFAEAENAAELLDDDALGKYGAKVVRDYHTDKTSRADWEDRARRAMDLAKQVKGAKSFPWDGASNVKYPMLTTAALQFAARAYPAIVDGPRIVKCQVLGFDDEQGTKASAADRISQHMSYQLLYELPEWESDMDTILHQIPIVGCAFRKVYPDQMSEAGFKSDFVSAFDLVVNQSARSLETVPRITHVFKLYPHEIQERQRAGIYLDVDLKGQSDQGTDDDAPEMFLEQHRYLDIDDDGVLEPWVVTVHEKTEKVVRIRPCFDHGAIITDQANGRIISIPRRPYFVMVPFIPDPDGGFYPVGFGHLLEPLSDVIDTTINQMMDAGTLQNAGGGFIASGVDLGKGKSTISLKPGQYRTVPTASQDLRQGIVNIEHPGPSKVLFELLSLMIDSGKDIAAIQDILVGDMPRNQTATTTMAMIEQGLKVFSAIYKRIYRALKAEFKMIYDINKKNARLDLPKYVALTDQPIQIVRKDYMGELNVIPVSDPNTITDMQRMAKAQLVLEEAKSGNPHVDVRAATKRAFEAARIERIDEVMVEPPTGPTPQEQIGLAGALAELEKVKADVEKVRADTEKVVVETIMAKLTAMLPLNQPLPVMQPQFTPPVIVEPPQEQPLPPMPGEMPPDMMTATPDAIGMPQEAQPMPDEAMPPFDMEQGTPPELADQIAAEQMAASDAMPGDVPL